MAVGLTVAVVSAGLLVMTRAGADTDRCTEFRAAARERAELVTGSGRDVLVIGDSYSVGLGVQPWLSWPTRLPGRVHVEGFSGSGFTRGASGCGASVSYADRAPRVGGYDVVVVEGGLNDVDQPAASLRRGFARLLARVGDRPVLVVGPARAPSRSAGAEVVDRRLARLASSYGVDYVSMLDEDLPYLDDNLHLTPAGHRQFGDRVAEALSSLG